MVQLLDDVPFLREEAGQCAPAGFIDEVPVEDGGVLLVQAAVVGVAPVDVVLDVVFVHLAAVPVCVEVVGGLGGGGPVHVPVQRQPVVLRTQLTSIRCSQGTR